jgi:hypothetical protein
MNVLRGPATFDVPVTFRNWNFAKNAVVYAVCSGALLWLNVVSSWGLQWLGIGLLAAAAASTAFFTASWYVAVLRVDCDHVYLGGLTKRMRIAWDDIDAFSIMAPADRTPFMIVFGPWRGQAHLLLRNGQSHRVRAVEPRYGFTSLTFVNVREVTDADRKVQWLNRFARTHRTLTP